MTCAAGENPGEPLFWSQMVVLFSAQALLGLCFLWSILPETHRVTPPVVLSSSPRAARMILDSVFLLGLGAGFPLSSRFLQGPLLRRQPALFLLFTLVSALSAGAAESWTLLVVTRALTGLSGAIFWVAAERTVQRAVPNFRRWQAMTVISLGFSSGFLVAGGFLVISLSPVLATAIVGSVVVLLTTRRFRDVTEHLADLGEADSTTMLSALSQPGPCGSDCGSSVSATASPAGCVSLSDGFESCAAGACCGDTGPTVRRTPTWIGTLLTMAGLLLFFGPLLEILAAALQVADVPPGEAATGALFHGKATFWLFGVAVAAGTAIFRTIVLQMGNTLALPLFLLLSVVTLPGATLTAEPSAAAVFTAVAGLLALSGSFHGCLAAVTEYFPASSVSRPSAACLTRGSLAASLVLAGAAGALVMAGETAVSCRIVGVILSGTASGAGLFALRKVPAPLLVTRFAERYLSSHGVR